MAAPILAQQLQPEEDAFYYRVIFHDLGLHLLANAGLVLPHLLPQRRPQQLLARILDVCFLALLVHLYWAYAGSCGHSVDAVFHHDAIEQHPGCIVDHPTPDLFLAAWWGLDVILAWLITDNIKWVRVQRGPSICWHS